MAENKNTEIVIRKVEENKEVQSLAVKVTEYAEAADKLEIKDEKQEKQAAELLAGIKSDAKQAEMIRKFFVDPYNAYVKAINARFAKFTDPLDAAKQVINRKLVEWDEVKRKKAAATQAKIMADMEKGKITEDKAVDKLAKIKDPEKPVVAETTSMTLRTDYKPVVVDEKAVPREYCSPDLAKFKEIAIAFHKAGQPQIPGIKVEEIKTPVNRRTY